MAVYCRTCANDRGLPKSAVRTAKEPCQFCNGYDQIEERKKKREGDRMVVVVKPKQLNNFSYPDRLIDNMPGNINSEADREYEGQTNG